MLGAPRKDTQHRETPDDVGPEGGRPISSPWGHWGGKEGGARAHVEAAAPQILASTSTRTRRHLSPFLHHQASLEVKLCSMAHFCALLLHHWKSEKVLKAVSILFFRIPWRLFLFSNLVLVR